MVNTEIVGILNITPDSFSDGGKYVDDPVRQAKRLFDEGATIVDIGAESTRPGASTISAEEEIARLSPSFWQLARDFPGRISLDTRNPQTLLAMTENLSKKTNRKLIVNDVTTFSNPAMMEAVANIGCLCIASHLPEYVNGNIRQAHKGERLVDSLDQVLTELNNRSEKMVKAGIDVSKIILDPGIGFGKTKKLNYQLLSFAGATHHDVMIGYSRKKFLGESRMDIDVNLNAGKIAIMSGAKYLRVHDVKPHVELVKSIHATNHG